MHPEISKRTCGRKKGRVSCLRCLYRSVCCELTSLMLNAHNRKENPPALAPSELVQHLNRVILHDKPRVTRYNISWEDCAKENRPFVDAGFAGDEAARAAEEGKMFDESELMDDAALDVPDAVMADEDDDDDAEMEAGDVGLATGFTLMGAGVVTAQ